MLLSRQGGVGNFCFNLHMSSFPVFCILSIQFKSCLSIFKHSSLGRPFFLFLPTSIHDFEYLGISVSTGGMTIVYRYVLRNFRFWQNPPFLRVHYLRLFQPILLLFNQPYPSHHPDHATLHPAKSELISHSTFLSFNTV